MKKIIITLALGLTFCSAAMAQISAGAGFLSQSISSKANLGNTELKDSDNANGFYVGAAYDFELARNLYLNAGLNYTFLTMKDEATSSLASVSSRTTRHGLEIPVNIKYSYPVLPSLDVFAYAGPSLSFALAGKTVTEASAVVGVSGSTETNLYGSDNSPKRFNLGINIGAGVDISDIVRVSVGYNFGLLDMDSLEDVTTRYNTLNIGVAILF